MHTHLTTALVPCLMPISCFFNAQHSVFTYALHLAILYMKLTVATVTVARQLSDNCQMHS